MFKLLLGFIEFLYLLSQFFHLIILIFVYLHQLISLFFQVKDPLLQLIDECLVFVVTLLSLNLTSFNIIISDIFVHDLVLGRLAEFVDITRLVLNLIDHLLFDITDSF